MPSATAAISRQISVGGGIRTIGASRHGGSAKSRKVWSAGTTRSATRKWWLPVPHSPAAVQVSSTCTSSGARRAMRSSPSASTQLA
jgi:hypothetical protein